MSTRPQTPSRGAADIVTQIRAHIKTQIKNASDMSPSNEFVAGYLYALRTEDRWIADWDRRARANPGGLGKEPKRKK